MGRFIREAVENMDSALNISHRSFSDDQKSSINFNTSPTDSDTTLNNEKSEMKSSHEGNYNNNNDNNNNNTAFSDTWVDSSEGINKEVMPQNVPLRSRSVKKSKRRILSNSSDALKGSEGHAGSKMHCKAGTKMLIFSGHDSTMVPLLKAIGLYHGTYVKDVVCVMRVCCLIVIETHRENFITYGFN